jgi:hypothetical protein
MIAGGLGVFFLGAISFCLALAHLLTWLSLPSEAEGLAALPLWASHGLVAVGLLGMGAAVAWSGYQKMKSITPLRSLASEQEGTLSRSEVRDE